MLQIAKDRAALEPVNTQLLRARMPITMRASFLISFGSANLAMVAHILVTLEL